MKTISQTLNLVSDGLPFSQAEWPAPANVKTLVSTRNGGVSQAPYSSLNVGGHVGDRPENVARNREIVQAAVPVPPAYLNQTHSSIVLPAADVLGSTPEADASFDRTGRAACAVMTADCLPVLLCDRAGTVVAAAHAGWRGLAGGVIEAAAQAVRRLGPHPPASAASATSAVEVVAWLGPCIGPDAFEIGPEVRAAFTAARPEAAACFTPRPGGKWLAHLPALARQRLAALGIPTWGNDGSPAWCTFSQPQLFHSYRARPVTGRMAACIWLQAGHP